MILTNIVANFTPSPLLNWTVSKSKSSRSIGDVVYAATAVRSRGALSVRSLVVRASLTQLRIRLYDDHQQSLPLLR